MAAIALALTAAAPSAAQDIEQPETMTGATEPLKLEELVVTGTRIRKPTLVSSSPIVQVDAEEVTLQGNVRVEDMLRNLPQVYTGQSAGQSNGATGTATLNLRNLGAERTLVLVNGRRLPAGSPLQGGVGADINQIPGALIESVDVLTGGASATYGSDAVAGVVNFRLMDDFEGIKLDYQFSQYQHGNDDDRWQQIVRDAGYETADGSVWDGDISNFSLIMGRSLGEGRGNVTVYGTYRDIKAVLQADRDYSSCALSNDLTSCSGSATQPQGTFSDFGALKAQGLEGFDYKVEGDRFVPRQGTLYNYGPSNYFQRPDERWTAGILAWYDLNERAEAYTELMFMDDRSVAQIAHSGAFFNTETLGCGNPFLSQQQFDALCGRYGLTEADVQSVSIGRRNVEGGNRQNDLRHTSYRGVLGLRGDLTDRWRYDLHYQYAKVRMENTYLNDLSITRIRRALDAVREPATGRIACRSALDGSDPDCVPWNIFREGAVTQEMIDYLTLPLSARGLHRTDCCVRPCCRQSRRVRHQVAIRRHRRRRGYGRRIPQRTAQVQSRRSLPQRRWRWPGRRQSARQRGDQGNGILRRGRCPAAGRRRALCGRAGSGRRLSLLRLRLRQADQHLRHPCRLGHQFRHQVADELPAGDSRAERAGTVPAAGLQPVRHERRPVRRSRRKRQDG